MPGLVLRAPRALVDGFERVRADLDVPRAFPPAVIDEAYGARGDRSDRSDRRELHLVAIDPPGSVDLDQAFGAERRGDGFRVWYAIADVGAFVRPGGAIDLEARARGTTRYSPDLRTPLHPTVISEDRASLLPAVSRPALLWTIDVDADGEPLAHRIERSMVEVDESITYGEAQQRIDTGGDETLELLAVIGRLREEREVDRGGISLNLPAQVVVPRDGTFVLEFDRTLPVEGWNAQVSLLTGMVAARTMVDAGVGILRTLPAPERQDIDALHRHAGALGLAWEEGRPYASFVRDLDAGTPAGAAFLHQAVRTFRGAGYESFAGEVPEHPEHGAIASVYSHVTAPIRRLVDRFGNEILLAVYADRRPPSWTLEALDELPGLMGAANQRQAALERAMVDFTEAAVLATRIGERFAAVVVEDEGRSGTAVARLTGEAVIAPVEAPGRSLGEQIHLRLVASDPAARTISFETTE